MTATNCLYLIATIFAVMGWQIAVHADDDVTVVPAPAATPTPMTKTATTDGTPVIHKSSHKKKTALANTVSAPAAAPTSTAASTNSVPAAPGASTVHLQQSVSVGPAPATSHPMTLVAPVPTVVVPRPQSTPVTVAKPPPIAPAPIKVTTVSIPVPATTTSVAPAPSLVPTVETGLPVARYPGMNGPIKGVSTYVPTPTPLPEKSVAGTTTHQPYYASILPQAVIPLTSSAAGSYSAPSRTTTPPPDFTFTNFTKKSKNTYPWKTGIITTMFYIGEGGSSISATDNKSSSWDEKWVSSNHGTDNPYDRNGFASADHASTVNPFYVALPFNDLAFQDKARQWVPRSWHRPNDDGKPVSACKDRWVWIKNANGRSCFAQWEDVGPLRYDHAEYVFGNDRPNTYTKAGLDVSPAVAQYLGIDENRRAITSWRFVDDEDVPPGQWLKYDEQAVIFTAMHQLKNGKRNADLPIQKASEPIDDGSTVESNKKKVDASKG